MNRFLFILVLLVVGVGCLGFYRGWFQVGSDSSKRGGIIGRQDPKPIEGARHRLRPVCAIARGEPARLCQRSASRPPFDLRPSGLGPRERGVVQINHPRSPSTEDPVEPCPGAIGGDRGADRLERAARGTEQLGPPVETHHVLGSLRSQRAALERHDPAARSRRSISEHRHRLGWRSGRGTHPWSRNPEQRVVASGDDFTQREAGKTRRLGGAVAAGCLCPESLPGPRRQEGQEPEARGVPADDAH